MGTMIDELLELFILGVLSLEDLIALDVDDELLDEALLLAPTSPPACRMTPVAGTVGRVRAQIASCDVEVYFWH
jgi:hypothetical protein